MPTAESLRAKAVMRWKRGKVNQQDSLAIEPPPQVLVARQIKGKLKLA